MNNLTKINPGLENAGQMSVVNSVHQGNGTPVILIHGLAASLHDWNDLIPELSGAGYAVHALDLLGHGKSGKPEILDEYTVDNVFAHYSLWIETLQINKPQILVGHSLGGYIALQYALLHPDRVFAIVLCDPFYSLSQLPLIIRLNYRHSLINTTLIEHIPEWIIRRAVDLTSLSIRNGYELPEAVRKQTAADYKRAQPGIFNILYSLHDLTPRLSSIMQPTLVLWGSHDRTLAPASFLKILQEIPNSRGSAIPGAGHVPHQSHSAEFNRQVLEFFQSISIPAR
jgi:pimeloyl-ACP methyl ester carboxylesterase